MKLGLQSATIRVFEPSELAPQERERLLGALEAFVNLGDTAEEFLAFGKQHPEFFPVIILVGIHRAPVTTENLEGFSFETLSWHPACRRLGLLFRDLLRRAWTRPSSGRDDDIEASHEFLALLNIKPQDQIKGWGDAFSSVLESYPRAYPSGVHFGHLWADWKTGSFLYSPWNEFQRAVYVLFREGWRAKTCPRCSRQFIAGKPRQTYCSPRCFGEAKSERGLLWWHVHGKRWRAKRAAKGGPDGGLTSRGPRKRKRKGHR